MKNNTHGIGNTLLNWDYRITEHGIIIHYVFLNNLRKQEYGY